MEVVAEEESRPCGATVWSGFLRAHKQHGDGSVVGSVGS